MKKNILNIAVFCVLIFSLSLCWLSGEKNEIVASERRKAAPMPPFSEILSEEYSGKFEDFMLDSFPLRENFRKINTSLRLDFLGQKDVNKIYKENGHLSKIDAPLDESSVLYVADKINSLKEKYFPEANVFYSAIPDKNYFLAASRPRIDYDKMLSLMQENTNAQYIDIFKTLTIDDYYFGDTHWRQEKILNTADTLLAEMGNEVKNVPCKENLIGDFKGVYASQAAIDFSDTLYCLENEYISSATVESAENGSNLFVYQTEKFKGVDPYDVYLGGAEAVLDIKRPLFEGEGEKHLILFRDSFGSSIAPLLLKNYSRITLLDLRYVSSLILDEFVNFENADILFLYNTQILNSGRLLK